ncbi:unnamed protein product, partial [Gulo gulo]
GAHTWLGVKCLQPRRLFQLDLLRKIPYGTRPLHPPQVRTLGAPSPSSPGPLGRGQAHLTCHLGLSNTEDVGPVLECFDKERICDSQDHVW